MKKFIILSLALILVLSISVSCRKKVEEVPPPPQQQEQPQATKVDEAAKVSQPALSEEEIFMSKTLEDINREMPLAMIYFDFDKYDIREDAKSVLTANAGWLNKFRTAKVLIEGHCDERGTEDYNLALGEKRAQSALEYIVSFGITPERMKIISYGKSQPLDPGHDEAAWARNRRAQFLVIEK